MTQSFAFDCEAASVIRPTSTLTSPVASPSAPAPHIDEGKGPAEAVNSEWGRMTQDLSHTFLRRI